MVGFFRKYYRRFDWFFFRSNFKKEASKIGDVSMSDLKGELKEQIIEEIQLQYPS